MPHNHDHAHAHGHRDFGAAFAIATALNLALVVAQFGFGWWANSVALLADAAHNLSDALGLLFAWGAHVVARWSPTERYTYGFRSASILSALINAALLFITTGAIAWEAVQRLADPGEVGGGVVMAVAAAAVVINGVSAWLLMSGRKGDLNIGGAFAHLAADAGVSVGVVIAGGIIMLTGWSWLDPVASLAISGFIIWGTWGLLSESVRLSMDAVPEGIDPAAVRRYLEQLPGVVGVHDLHIWAMSTTENALTAHLVMPSGHPGDAFLGTLCEELHGRFEIKHPTLQIELDDDKRCALAPEHLV